MNTIARYYRCALQVNSASYSKFRGKAENNETEYNQRIVDQCKKNNISVVGLADHGSVDSSESLRLALENAGIVVFPGFEISSAEKIHMVCLFPPELSSSQLNRILGDLGLADATIGTEPSTKTCLEIAESVLKRGGFWYAAHITGDNGILKTGSFNNIWKNSLLVAAQIPAGKDQVEQKYRNILKNKEPEYKRPKIAALINAKDVESPDDLDIPECSVLIKMTTPSFKNFLNAFKDPESRIRLISELEKCYQSCINSVEVSGGYLDGFFTDFSENLTTVIGGRGTGKSTLVSLIRYALEREPLTSEAKKDFYKLIDNNLGTGGIVTLKVTSNARHGECFTIKRRYKNEHCSILDSQGETSSFTLKDILPTIEIYGQNEIIEISRDKARICEASDRLFTHSVDIEQDINLCHQRLIQNGKSLDNLEAKIEKIKDDIGELPQINEKLRYYKEAGLEDKLAVIGKLSREEGIFSAISKAIENVKHSAFPRIKKPDCDGECFSRVNTSIDEFNQKIDEYNTQYLELFMELKKTLELEKRNWERGKEDYDDELRNSLKTIEGIQDKSSEEIVKEYSSLVRQEAERRPLKSQLDEYEEHHKTLLSERRNLIEKLRTAFDKRDAQYRADMKKINKKKLNGSVRIDIECRQNKSDLISFLCSKVNGVAQKSLDCLTHYISFDVFEFANHLRQGKEKLIEVYGFKHNTAKLISETLTKSDIRLIEQLILSDIVKIELNVNGTFKELESLSKGQQCTAILNLLLLDNRDPLIIDQPEDNLDNSFIAENLVDSLRCNKIRRQYILISHNANIPVFGDAEQIIAMEDSGGRGCIATGGCGSIDEPSVQQHVINILEGGIDAFKMREEKYGIKSE